MNKNKRVELYCRKRFFANRKRRHIKINNFYIQTHVIREMQLRNIRQETTDDR